jgi:hypothetical protein
MKITKYFTKYSQSVTISLRDPHNLGEITIGRHMEMGTDTMVWEQTKINWCACGSQTIAQTIIFSDAMKVAIEIAKQMESGNVSETYFK